MMNRFVKLTKIKKYRINEIKMEIEKPLTELPVIISRLLSVSTDEITDWRVVKESIDARDKTNIRMVYSVEFDTNKTIPKKILQKNRCSLAKPKKRYEPKPGSEIIKGRPVVVGFGPAGIFASLELARRGYRPLVIERGCRMDDRVKDVDRFTNKSILNKESNILFGEGGAGTFSDGKLTTGIKDPNIGYILREFAKAGAGDEIIYKNKPHIGTDVLRSVVVRLREEVIGLGGEILFNAKLQNVSIESGELSSISVRVSKPKEEHIKIRTNALILATGHSARDTYEMLDQINLEMEQKPLSIGVRISHPQSLIDKAMYGDEKRLPPADYKLSYKASNGRGVYSFCMCPGGEVVTCATDEGELCVNGMSKRRRNSGTANSGILCDVRTDDFDGSDALAGVRFQQKYERLAFVNGGGNFKSPECTMKEFMDKSGTSVINSMPDFAYEAIREAIPNFARKIKGYDSDAAIINAVETRSSAPLRVIRNKDTGESSRIRGIYPTGEGSGYAGGIMSAACDGIKQANKIIERFSNNEELTV